MLGGGLGGGLCWEEWRRVGRVGRRVGGGLCWLTLYGSICPRYSSPPALLLLPGKERENPPGQSFDK